MYLDVKMYDIPKISEIPTLYKELYDISELQLYDVFRTIKMHLNVNIFNNVKH